MTQRSITRNPRKGAEAPMHLPRTSVPVVEPGKKDGL
jgi:hypothetical protein